MRYLSLFLLIFSSCSPVYIPNLRQSPLFAKPGEMQGAVQVGGGLTSQAAVALSNHIGVTSSFMYLKDDLSEAQGEDEFSTHRFWEAGLGYFTNKNKHSWEVYAGFGMGEGSNNDEYYLFDPDPLYVTGKYKRFYIQPALGWNWKIVQLSVVTRFSFLNMYSFSNNQNSMVITSNNIDVFFEPAVICRVNLLNNYLFLTSQVGTAAATTSDQVYDYIPFTMGMGVGFRLGGLRNKSFE